jgi:hypothetical protein
MFMNLSANLKHIDNLVRVNHGYEDEGISMNYQSMMSSEEIVNDDTLDDFYKPDPKPVSRLRTRSRGGN